MAEQRKKELHRAHIKPANSSVVRLLHHPHQHRLYHFLPNLHHNHDLVVVNYKKMQKHENAAVYQIKCY